MTPTDQPPQPTSGKPEVQPPAQTPRPIQSPLEPPLWNNPITAAGMFIATVSLILLVTFGVFNAVAPPTNPYVDIVGYMVIPTFLILGIFLVPLGTLAKSWWIRRHRPEQPLRFGFPRINLEDPAQRRAAKYLAAGTVILLPVVAVASYHGYHFTDSTEFCAEACHKVMVPEARAFYDSAHARVPCAECHIGAGASWFVKSKLSGTRQVIAMFTESYSRPIPPAIQELRPARETCEECHWPKKFYGAQLREIDRYASDEENSHTRIRMLVKTGGGELSGRHGGGIHSYHVGMDNQVEYVATDDELQVIPWVRWTTNAGVEQIFRSDGLPASAPRPEGLVRRLDCMDCHNRAAHRFQSPSAAIDLRMASGKIDTTLPFIKRVAVTALVQEYPDELTALTRIEAAIEDYYQEKHPELWQTRRASINQAVEAAQEAYRRNFFPYMRVNWRTYPDNVGHKYTPGCYRCHDGRHMDASGKTISHDCNICHTFLNPVPGEEDESVVKEGEFIHPTELVGLHANLACHQCHTGGISPETSCTGCHSTTQSFYGGSGELWSPFAIQADVMFDGVGCQDCHDDLSVRPTMAKMNETCLFCHDDEEERFDGMVARWSEEIGRLSVEAAAALEELATAGPLPEAEAAWLAKAREQMAALNEAGPLHNIEAARKIYGAIRDEAQQRRAALPARPPGAETAERPHDGSSRGTAHGG